MSDQHYYTVGVHGPPTRETAPHGVMWRRDDDSSTTLLALWKYRHRADPWPDEVEWWPAPAPPTEQAPPPEPEPLWTRGPGITILRRVGEGHKKYGVDDADYLVDIANALDRDGVAWGPGRPMSELPDGNHPRVLLRADGGPYVASNTYRSTDAEHKRLCWWPLPREAR